MEEIDLEREVFVERAVIDSILSYAKLFHPNEAILLLKGKVDKKKIVVNDVYIPPLATHGSRFSSFPTNRLPINFSVVGVAHSHPSGALRASTADLNHFYGRLMLITAYPYQSEKNIIIIDHNGEPQNYILI